MRMSVTTLQLASSAIILISYMVSLLFVVNRCWVACLSRGFVCHCCACHRHDDDYHDDDEDDAEHFSALSLSAIADIG